MADIISIDDLRKKFNEKMSLEEWKDFATSQHNLIEQMAMQVRRLEEKNKHLENILMSKSSGLALHLAPEEVICLQQIAFLEEQSMKRALTLDEVKRLDLLVKNLNVIRETAILEANKAVDQLKEADLVAIVQSSNRSDT